MDRILRVGEMAPDFQALIYQEGQSSEVRLTQYRGKWVILLFYIGDFTVV